MVVGLWVMLMVKRSSKPRMAGCPLPLQGAHCHSSLPYGTGACQKPRRVRPPLGPTSFECQNPDLYFPVQVLLSPVYRSYKLPPFKNQRTHIKTNADLTIIL